MCFYLCTQIACLWGCKVTWLHLFDFSPLYVFKCLLKWTATEDSYCIVTMLALQCIGSIFLHCGGIITLIAFVWFFCTVYYKMLTQRSWIRAGKVALVAFVWLSSRVRFQMCPQMACPRTTDFQNFYVCGKNQTYVGIANDYLNYHVCCFLPHMHGFAKYLRYVKVFPNTG